MPPDAPVSLPPTGSATVPNDALILLVGPAGAGKTTWAEARFIPSQVLSSDAFRAMVADDPADQSATREAFSLLHAVARSRLRRGLVTVVDATNLLVSARRPLIELARRAQRPVVAVVFEVPLSELLARNARRERVVPEETVRWHHHLMTDALLALPAEGFIAIIRT
jgi:protein phosphatase